MTMTEAPAPAAAPVIDDAGDNNRTRVYLLAGLAGLGVVLIIVNAVRRAQSSPPAPAVGAAPAPAGEWSAALKHVCDAMDERHAAVLEAHEALARAVLDVRARVDQLAGADNVVEPGTVDPLPAPAPAATSGTVPPVVELPPLDLDELPADVTA